MSNDRLEWGGVPCYVVHDLPAGAAPGLVVVLCHGFGAPGTDLVGLAQPLLAASPMLASSAAFVFPTAPLALDTHGMPGGRAWWMIDLERLIYSPSEEALLEFCRDCPVGMPEARQALQAVIDGACQRFGVDTSRLVLGGFSQGAMLATDVALRLPTAPAGLCILSGGLTNERQWRELAAQRGKLTVLQSHGRYDSILPFPLALALRDLLQGAGASVDFLEFPGDHEIPLAVLQRLVRFLESVAA